MVRYLLFLSLLFVSSLIGKSQTISTIAGTGTAGLSGDGGPATAAQIANSYYGGIAVDTARNVYIADYGNSLVRKINSAGIITTIAGVPAFAGFTGDGGPATAGRIACPIGLNVDRPGNLYICGYNVYRIRKVNTAGIISTLVGTGSPGFSGDGGPATAAQINQAWGVATDTIGNVYLADQYNHRIRKIDTTGIITTIAGNGTSGFSGDGGPATAAEMRYPVGIAVDIRGNIYFSDLNDCRIRKIDNSGIITTIAGVGSGSFSGDGGPATSAHFYNPAGIAVDTAGNVLVADSYNNRIRRINATGIITTIAGSGPTGSGTGSYGGDGGAAVAAFLNNPYGVAIDLAGNVIIADNFNERVRKVSGNDRAPYFTSGASATFIVCQNSIATPVNGLLSVIDSDAGQSETWGLLSGPYHGSASVAYTMTSTGITITPSGITYTPSTGYSGLDTFKITVNDGYLSDTITLYVTINPTPAAISGTNIVCTGSTTLLSDATSGGTWYSGSTSIATIGTTGLVTGITGGASIISYTLATGCMTTLTVTVYTFPLGITGISAVCPGTTTTLSDATGGGSWSSGSPAIATIGSSSGIVSGVATGITVIYYTTGGICTVMQTVTVNTAPLAITGTRTVCSGTTTTLSDIPAGGTWSSTSTSIVSVGTATGVITGIASGIAVITYSVGSGCAATATVTVYASPAPIGGASTVCTGAAIGLSDGTSGGLWSSASTGIATVSTSGVVSGITAGIATISYTTGGICPVTKSVTVYTAPVPITGTTLVCNGHTSTLIDTSAGGVWTSSNVSIATVGSLTGIVTGNTLGTATITYILPGSCRVTKLVTVTTTPSSITGVTGICGTSTTSLYSAPSGGTWTSGSGWVATVGATSGLVAGLSAGTTLITYSLSTGCSSSITVSVFPTPGTITGTTSVCTGVTMTIADTPGTGIWTSSNPATATVGSSSGIVTGVSAGVTFITYTLPDGCFATTTITVNAPPGPITGIAVTCIGSTTTVTDPGGGIWSSASPGIATIGSLSGIVTGVSAGSAVITYSLGPGCSTSFTVNVSPVPTPVSGTTNLCAGSTSTLSDGTGGGYWTSSSPGIASVGSATGIITGVGPGTALITYAVAPGVGCSAAATVTVNAYPGVIGGVTSVCTGLTTSLAAGGTGTWSSGTTGIATIGSLTGIVTGIAAGTAIITYTIPPGCSTTTVVTVNPLPLPVTGPTHICLGSTITLSDATGSGYWTSSDATIADADAGTGIITGVSFGTATITYTLVTGCISTRGVIVDSLPDPITGISSVCSGSLTTLSDVAGGGTWSSSLPGIAIIGSASGIVTGVAAGTSTITYSIGASCTITTVVTVNPLPTVILGPINVCIGASVTLFDGVPGGTWSRSNTNVTIVPATGLVTGMAAGTTIITYTIPTGCYMTKTITVNSTPGIISGNLHLCLGATTTVSDSATGGIWSSSSPSIATIGSSSGIITGIALGTTTVTYSIGSGCLSTAIVTVNALPSGIAGASALCAGSTITLSDTISGGNWSSGAPGIATAGSSSGIVAGISSGTALITYALPSGCYKTKTVTVLPSPAVITGTTHLCAGDATILSNTVAGGAWSSASPSIATIGSASGIVSGISSGLATITYTLGSGCNTTKIVTINPLPSPITGLSVVCAGGATISLIDGTTGGTWSASGTALSIGSISGIVTGLSAGSSVITYALPTGCFRTTIISVNPVPSPITGPSAVCSGSSIALADITVGGTWSSSTTTIGTIGSSSGTVAGISIGTTTISYTLPTGCRMTTIVTVSTTPVSVTGVTTVCTGAATTLTDGVPGGLWISGSTGIATIGSLSGTVSGIAPGTTLITYSLGSGCTVTKTVTVTPSPTAITGSTSVCTGSSTILSDGMTGGVWTSSTTSVAAIGATSGILNTLTPGFTTITYSITSTGCTATLVITVNPSPAPITGPSAVCTDMSVTEADITTGGTWSSSYPSVTIGSVSGSVTGITTGTAVITYSLGSCPATRTLTVNGVSPITGASGVCVGATTSLFDPATGGTWSSPGSSGIISIGSATGIVTGLAAGTALVSYAAPTGCVATKTVTVNSGPFVISGTTHVCLGGTTILTDSAGGGIWSSSPTGIATIGSLSGLVSGLSSGTTIITYSLGTGCTVTRALSVNPLPFPISGASSLCAGSTTSLTDLSTGGAWSNTGYPGILSVGSSSGIVTGISSGTSVITYMLPTGCIATRTETVNAEPALVTGFARACIGQTTPLYDATTGGIWSSSSPSIASVGSGTGIVSGIVAGTATITYTLSDVGGCFTTAMVTVNPLPAPITGAVTTCIGSSTTFSDATPGGTWNCSGTTGIVSVGSVSGVVTGISAGIAIISYSSASGCITTKTITVNPLPTAITGINTVCIGTSTALFDSTSGGMWTSSNSMLATIGSGTGLVTGVNAGTATITYATGTGCFATIPVTINLSPPVITGTNHVCAGQTISLSDSVSGGSWVSGSPGIATIGSASGIVTGILGGTVTVSYTVPGSGCILIYPVTVNSVPPITGLSNLCAWGDTITIHDSNPAGSYSSTSVTILNLGSGNGKITANAPGTCSVTYTLTMGCFTTSVFTVNPLPGLITGSTNECIGFSTTFFNSVAGGLWSSSNPAIATAGSATGMITGISSGTAIITYSLPTGCKADTVIHVNPSPGMIIGYPTLVVSTSSLYTDFTPAGIWSSSNIAIATIGAGSGIVHGVTVGSVTITYSLGTGCIATKVLSVNPFTGVSTEDIGANACTVNSISILPNPNNGTFYLTGTSLKQNFSQENEEIRVEITDMLGRSVYSNQIIPQNGQIDTRIVLSDRVKNGMYLLTLQSGMERRVMHLAVSR